jgi:hypothetical protein
LLRLLVCALALALCASAQGEPAPEQNEQQDLYLDAMRSITEGRKKDASEALIRLIEQEPQHAGAWLDLAIIQCELGRANEAERLFKIIESRFSPPPGILEVIAKQRAHGCKGWQPQSQLSIMFGRGIDDNVNQGASNPNFSIGTGSNRIDLQILPEYLPQRDQYTLASVDYTRELNANGSSGFFQFQARQNDTLSRYNTASLALGLNHPWRVGGWGVRGTGALSLLTLGGNLYQQQSQIQARIVPPLVLPADLEFNMLTGVTHVRYPTLENFNAALWELRGQMSYRTEQLQANASAGYLFDHGEAGRPGGNRRGWLANVQGRMRIVNDIVGEAGLTYQTWLGQSAYLPGFIDVARHQKTLITRGALIIPIDKRQAIQIELRQIKNTENISLFQYNSRLLQISWQWQNF